MKKFLVSLGLVLGLILSTGSFAYSSDLEKAQEITNIGTLATSNQYEQALEKCNAAMEKYPDDAELYYWRANIKTHMDKFEEAQEDYSKAIELNPNNPSIYVMRGIVKSELGDNQGAMEDLNYAIKLDPNHVSAYSIRACIKIELNDLKGADEDLEKANVLLEKSLQTTKKDNK